MGKPNPQKAWRIQWRVSGLLVLVTVCGVFFAVRERVVQKYEQKLAALEWYEELDPFFSYELRPARPKFMSWFISDDIYQDVATVHWDLLDLPKENRDRIMAMTPEELFGRFRHFRNVEVLSFEGRVTDECLRIILSDKTKVEALKIQFTEVTPAGLTHLSELNELQALGIPGVDETSPPILNSLENLTSINIADVVANELIQKFRRKEKELTITVVMPE